MKRNAVTGLETRRYEFFISQHPFQAQYNICRRRVHFSPERLYTQRFRAHQATTIQNNISPRVREDIYPSSSSLRARWEFQLQIEMRSASSNERHCLCVYKRYTYTPHQLSILGMPLCERWISQAVCARRRLCRYIIHPRARAAERESCKCTRAWISCTAGQILISLIMQSQQTGLRISITAAHSTRPPNP